LMATHSLNPPVKPATDAQGMPVLPKTDQTYPRRADRTRSTLGEPAPLHGNPLRGSGVDKQAHVPCPLRSFAEPAHAPGSTSAKDERTLAPGLSLSNNMWLLLPTMVVMLALAFAPNDQWAWVPTTRTSPRSKRERFDKQAHVPCLFGSFAKPAHAPGATSSKDKRALAPGSSSSDQMWSLPSTTVVSAALAFAPHDQRAQVPMTWTSPRSKRERFDEQVHAPCLLSWSAERAHPPGSTSSKDKRALAPGLSLSNQM
jgi:hypothetical protein